jgi:hypothetical protein
VRSKTATLPKANPPTDLSRSELTDSIETPRVKHHQCKILMGDFNADLLRGHLKSNKAVQHHRDVFVDFLSAIGYITTAQSLNDNSITYRSRTRNSNTATLDYIVLPKRFISGCHQMKVIDAPISTDHRCVMTSFSAKWRESSKPQRNREGMNPSEQPDYDALGADPQLRRDFSKSLAEELGLRHQGSFDLGLQELHRKPADEYHNVIKELIHTI